MKMLYARLSLVAHWREDRKKLAELIGALPTSRCCRGAATGGWCVRMGRAGVARLRARGYGFSARVR